MITCPSCSSTAIDRSELRWPIFRHLDFTDVAATGGVIECRVCGAVAAADFDRVAAVHHEFLHGAKYVEAAPTAHVIPGQRSGDTRPAQQAAWITEHLKACGITSPSILDVGCFDGALLKELSTRWSTARRLAGCEPNPTLAPFFPQEQPFEFHAKCRSLVGASFDVIMASHSLMYDRQLPTTLANLAKLLAKNGLLIMVMPDIFHNSTYLLMGDQYWFGSSRHLISLFQQQGLSVRRGLSEDWGHDLVLLASVSDGKPPPDSMPPDRPAQQLMPAMMIFGL